VMASMEVARGSFSTSSASPGKQSCGFKPTSVLFFFSFLTEAGTGAIAQLHVGVAGDNGGSLTQFAFGLRSADDNPQMHVRVARYDTAAFVGQGNSSSPAVMGTITTDATGFTPSLS